jgi:hypothetical protein
MCRTLQRVFTIGVAVLLFGQVSASPWDDEPPSLRDRLYFGGNFGLSFGNQTSIVISPIAGYYITPRLSAGLGFRYEYFKFNYPGFVPYDTHIFGGSVFSRYTVIKSIGEVVGLGGMNTGLFIQGEYEMLSLESQYFDLTNPSPGERFNLHSMLVGGGIYQPIGRRSGFLLTVLWNLNDSYNSIYSNPIVRIGFTF